MICMCDKHLRSVNYNAFIFIALSLLPFFSVLHSMHSAAAFDPGWRFIPVFYFPFLVNPWSYSNHVWDWDMSTMQKSIFAYGPNDKWQLETLLGLQSTEQDQNTWLTSCNIANLNADLMSVGYFRSLIWWSHTVVYLTRRWTSKR